MKTIFQKENYSCGPVSILNALNYFDLNKNNKIDEYSLIKVTKAKPKIGSENEDLENAIDNIEDLQFKKSKINSTINDIKKEIDEGNVVIVNYYNPFSEVGHYAMIFGYDENSLFFRDSSLGDLRLTYNNFEKFWYNGNKTIYGYYLSVGKKKN